MGLGSAVADAAVKLRLTLLRMAIADRASPLHEARLEDLQPGGDGAIIPKGSPTRTDTLAAIVRRSGQEAIAADGAWSPGGGLFGVQSYAMYTFGAVFVEVRVDAELAIPRVTRCVGAYSAGRIINPKTARSQMTGGMIWGIGQALLERSETDGELGRFLSKNLAGYLVPVNADIGQLEAYFVDEVDWHASALGAKGIGELGATGVAAAVANAVFHATGVRVRDLPHAARPSTPVTVRYSDGSGVPTTPDNDPARSGPRGMASASIWRSTSTPILSPTPSTASRSAPARNS